MVPLIKIKTKGRLNAFMKFFKMYRPYFKLRIYEDDKSVLFQGYAKDYEGK